MSTPSPAKVLSVQELRKLLLGLGLAVLYIVLAFWFFTRIYRYAVRTGLIARYSAESVS